MAVERFAGLVGWLVVGWTYLDVTEAWKPGASMIVEEPRVQSARMDGAGARVVEKEW